MSQDVYPPADSIAIEAEVFSEVTEAPSDGEITSVSLNKNLEMRIKSDLALRSSIEMLIHEVKDFKDIIKLIFEIR